MRTLRIFTPIAVSLLSLTAYSLAITGSVNAQSERMMLPAGKSAVFHKINTVPSPQSGIKLIEFISWRIHSLKTPVIASKTQYRQALQEEGAGPTNKLLAIQPPSQGWVPPQDAKQESSKFYQSPRQIQIIDDKQVIRDARETPAAAPAESAAFDANSQSRRSMDFMKKSRSEVASKPTSNVSTYARTRAMPEGMKSLGQSIANLNGAMSRADEMMQSANDKNATSRLKTKVAARQQASYQIANNPAPPTGIWEPAKGLGKYGSFGGSNAAATPAMNDDTAADGAAAQLPPLPANMYRNMRVAPNFSKQPGDNQYSTATNTGGLLNKDQAKRGALVAQGSAQPKPSSEPAGAGGAAPPPPPQNEKGYAHGSLLNRKATDIVAMLPPNVITGIPLVRLGSSADDANRALLSIKGNKVEKQNINGWTVFVMHKANSPDPAMHVYMRHGLVEALRIFDSGLIAPDFGVQLNDDLQVMKSKFGEPTFMHDEPECPKPARIKNYVYPISQVSFEVAQTTPTSPPKVVSILIFTVK